MSKHSKKLDLNKLAKRIVDEAIGEIQPEEIDEKKKSALDKKRLKENKEKTITELK
jgi:hypothetical protein